MVSMSCEKKLVFFLFFFKEENRKKPYSFKNGNVQLSVIANIVLLFFLLYLLFLLFREI